MKKTLSSTLFLFTVNWTQTAGFVTALNPLSSLYGISCRFEFHNLWRAWNRQHWLFIIWHFSLFTNIAEKSFKNYTHCRKLKLGIMILFISNSWSCFFAKSLLYLNLVARYFSFSFNFNHTEIEKGGYSIYIMEWKSNSSYPCIKYITSYPQRFNVLWCPTLVLLSQTCFLLFLPGSNGYDINCWFQVKMIINIRNVLFLFGLFAPKAKLVK